MRSITSLPAYFLPQLLHHPFPQRQRIPNIPARHQARQLFQRKKIVVAIAVDAVGLIVVLPQIGPGEGHAERHLARAGHDVRAELGGRFARLKGVRVGGGGGSWRGILHVSKGGSGGGGRKTDGVGFRVHGLDDGGVLVLLEPGMTGGAGGVMVDRRGSGRGRSDVDFMLFEGRKAEFEGLVEFLRRGQEDSQFESRFGVLVVSC